MYYAEWMHDIDIHSRKPGRNLRKDAETDRHVIHLSTIDYIYEYYGSYKPSKLVLMYPKETRVLIQYNDVVLPV